METPVSSESNDWDRPFTEEELQEIDIAFQSATRRLQNSDDSSSAGDGDEYRRKSRRRLPESLFVFNFQNEASNSMSSLSPCTRSRSQCSYSFRSSTQAKIVMQYPEISFKGRVIYSRTNKEVEKSAVELLKFVEEKKRKEGHVALGFDIEWRPSFRKGVAPGKAAVMQICGDMGSCYVLHIIHSGIPQTLQSLLEDPTVVKVGVCIANDAYKVSLDHNVSVKTLEDLSELANKKLDEEPKKWSLASLTEKLLAKQLPKPSKIRLGNWEANELSKEKLHYAATDAFVSWYLYQALKSLPEIVDNKT
ncbi:PREDICTED: Werner Syndrome-like exonuclease isoform X2 [Nicotiana attenuata]|uniref:Werner Syndrome-like exonuclease isoform X2 n=1 Tax=Nicotiana attenuata TaxID=49451 RepID=UPI000904A262|nr:PREDICTED: Werner Syndrome-like exonuclease isoform X2 [Nicotiana attenuata]